MSRCQRKRQCTFTTTSPGRLSWYGAPVSGPEEGEQAGGTHWNWSTAFHHGRLSPLSPIPFVKSVPLRYLSTRLRPLRRVFNSRSNTYGTFSTISKSRNSDSPRYVIFQNIRPILYSKGSTWVSSMTWAKSTVKGNFEECSPGVSKSQGGDMCTGKQVQWD